MNPFLVGVVLAGGKLTKSLLQGRVGSYTDRIGHKYQFVIAGALVYALGAAIIPLAEYAGKVFPTLSTNAFGGITLVPAFFVLFGAFAIIGVADSLRLPASMALFVEEGEHFDAVAASLSLRSIGWKVGQVAGPFTVGRNLGRDGRVRRLSDCCRVHRGCHGRVRRALQPRSRPRRVARARRLRPSVGST